MPPRVHLGVNLNFAKFVYGQKKAIDIVRDEFGLNLIEAVTDFDFGPTLYQTNVEAYRAYYRDIGQHAADRGVGIETVLTFYRDTAAIAHPNADVRESTYIVGKAMLEAARCYGARLAGSMPFTMDKEIAGDPKQFKPLFDAAIEIWNRWRREASDYGLEGLIIEAMSTLREGCSTIVDTRETLDAFDRAESSEPMVPMGLLYDVGHGISETESSDPRDRDFEAWIGAFPDRIVEIHLKDTDPLFQATFHFGSGKGIIDLEKLFRVMRETITVPRVVMFLEIPGKRARDIGEIESIEEHKRSIALLHAALESTGYRKDSDTGEWVP